MELSLGKIAKLSFSIDLEHFWGSVRCLHEGTLYDNGKTIENAINSRKETYEGKEYGSLMCMIESTLLWALFFLKISCH